MRIVRFDNQAEIPVVAAFIKGQAGSQRVRLVFDTGAGFTQFDTSLLEDLGYSAVNATELIRAKGPVGDFQEGYLLNLKQMSIFGLQFSDFTVGAYDFDNFDSYGIDGLLGFDVIKQLHLEMDGPEGVLRVF